MKVDPKTSLLLGILTTVFLAIAAVFLMDLPGRKALRPEIPLVDPTFISTATVRMSYAELVASKADLSDFDCYGCHEKNKPPTLRFDAITGTISATIATMRATWKRFRPAMDAC